MAHLRGRLSKFLENSSAFWEAASNQHTLIKENTSTTSTDTARPYSFPQIFSRPPPVPQHRQHFSIVTPLLQTPGPLCLLSCFLWVSQREVITSSKTKYSETEVFRVLPSLFFPRTENHSARVKEVRLTFCLYWVLDACQDTRLCKHNYFDLRASGASTF